MLQLTIDEIALPTREQKETASSIIQNDLSPRVVILKETEGSRTLSLRISGPEAEALATLHEDSSLPPSMPHDLVARLLHALGARLDHIALAPLHENLYCATLQVKHNNTQQTIDARPVDALILAQLTRAPICVEHNVLQPIGVIASEEGTRDIAHLVPLPQGEREPVPGTPTTEATPRIAPGPRGSLLVGSLLEFQRDPLRFLMDLTRQYGDVVRFRIGPWAYHLVTHPDHVKHVLQDHNQQYRKGRIAGILESITGQSVLVAEGNVWLRQRRLAQPAFHRQRIAALATTMTDTVAPLLDQWRTYVGNSQPLNIWPAMQNVALGVVGRTLFSTDLTGGAEAVGHAATTMVEHLNYRFTHPLPVPQAVPTPRNRRFQAAIRFMDNLVYSIIRERRRTGASANDLLSMLMEVRDEDTGEAMSDQQLRNEVLTFLFAGYETTASALMWTWYLLGQHPASEQRLRDELTAVLNGRTPTFADLHRLLYTRMVLEETMRLYPPGWIFERKAISDDTIGGCHIPAGSFLFLCPYVTHHRSDVWEEPERFEPERFTSERSTSRPRYAYFPFGGGPRQCIGNEFAMMECQLVVAMVLQRYRLCLTSVQKVEPDALAATLRTRHGLWMTVHDAKG